MGRLWFVDDYNTCQILMRTIKEDGCSVCGILFLFFFFILGGGEGTLVYVDQPGSLMQLGLG